MSQSTDNDGAWASLNGHRVPIALFLTLAGLLITMWADLRDVKTRVANLIPESRIAVAEEQIKQLRIDMQRSDENLRRTDEASKQHRDVMQDHINRLERDMREQR